MAQTTDIRTRHTIWFYYVLVVSFIGYILRSKRIQKHLERIIKTKKVIVPIVDTIYKIHKYPDTDSRTGHVFFIDKGKVEKRFLFWTRRKWTTVRNRKGHSFACWKLIDAQKAVEDVRNGIALT